MIDKVDRKLLALLQKDCTLSLQALAEAVNLTTTPCWKRLKKLEDDGIIRARVALLDGEKLGLSKRSSTAANGSDSLSPWLSQCRKSWRSTVWPVSMTICCEYRLRI